VGVGESDRCGEDDAGRRYLRCGVGGGEEAGDLGASVVIGCYLYHASGNDPTGIADVGPDICDTTSGYAGTNTQPVP